MLYVPARDFSREWNEHFFYQQALSLTLLKVVQSLSWASRKVVSILEGEERETAHSQAQWELRMCPKAPQRQG